MDYFEALYRNLDVNIIAVPYRGYSRSDGIPTEEGLKIDAEVWISHLVLTNLI
jgi:hypothetical protein